MATIDFLLYNHKIKQVANWLLSQPLLFANPIYQYLQKQQINKIIKQYRCKPFALRIENTNHCNAQCFMCPHSTMKRPQGVMSRQLYKKIINQAVSWNINYINLHNFGEPLIDPDFVWKIKYAKKQGITKISTNTNGQLLNKNLSKQLIKAGLDEIYISLDAASTFIYQKIRIGLDYKTVVHNIKTLIKTRQQNHLQKPKIVVDFLKFNLNQHQTKKFIHQWQKLADKVCISQIHDWTSKKQNLTKTDYKNYVSLSHSPCRLPFTEMLILWNGQVSLCCQDIEGQLILGDTNEQPLDQIWTNQKFQKIRTQHLKLNTNRLPLCKNCKLRTFWWLF